MSSPVNSSMQYTALGKAPAISRVIRGNWQLAAGHANSVSNQAVDDLIAAADAGITTFDCADIYTGVEALLGTFRQAYFRKRGKEALARIRVHTKYVPDLSTLSSLNRQQVVAVIDRSLHRLQTEQLDLVQFHWWDYAQPHAIEVASWLAEQRLAGKIRDIGATNFDTEHLIQLTDAGVPLVSLQVQYSLLDARPARRMAQVANALSIGLLCYGTVAGGFLSDVWLDADEPAEPLENRSLVKYRLIIEEFGGWQAYQALLRVLRQVADRHHSDIATVASSAVLHRDAVVAVIVGARNRTHLEANLAIAALSLDDEDRVAIDAVVGDKALLPGDVYTLERDRQSPHGAIMKYELGGESV